MKFLAEARAKQLRDHSNFPKAGVYDPPGVGGTGVIYVLHDASQPELYGGVAGQRGHDRRAGRIICSLLEVWSEVARGRTGDQARRRTAVTAPEHREHVG